MYEFKDYYSILNITPDASIEDIKEAYRKLCKRWHPDKNPQKDVTEIMQDINEAYFILKDIERRKRFDIEYRKFQDFKRQQEITRTESHHYYDYKVQDNAVKQDIQNARQEAIRFIQELKISIAKNSKDAFCAAIMAILPYIIILLVGLCIWFITYNSL